MAIQISGTTVIDNSRNITNVTTSTSNSVVINSSLTLPSGNTASRPANPSVGSIRWNTDVSTIEVHTGSNVWKQVTLGFTVVDPASVRGIFSGAFGQIGYARVDIEYVTIATTGNTSSFGSLSTGRGSHAGCSSTSRGIFSGGSSYTNYYNTIEYITIATTGNGTFFGNLNRQVARYHASCSNDTRGLFNGGLKSSSSNDYTNAIEYVTIATTGSSISFGVTPNGWDGTGACASNTRGVFIGGSQYNPFAYSYSYNNTLSYVTIATIGNSTQYGTISEPAISSSAACSSSTRGVFASSSIAPAFVLNRIQYFTIDSGGSTSYFGNLTVTRRSSASTSSPTRGLFAGGVFESPGPGGVNVIDYITIASAGNATDFGDLNSNNYGSPFPSNAYTGLAACSNGHGGLPVV